MQRQRSDSTAMPSLRSCSVHIQARSLQQQTRSSNNEAQTTDATGKQGNNSMTNKQMNYLYRLVVRAAATPFHPRQLQDNPARHPRSKHTVKLGWSHKRATSKRENKRSKHDSVHYGPRSIADINDRPRRKLIRKRCRTRTGSRRTRARLRHSPHSPPASRPAAATRAVQIACAQTRPRLPASANRYCCHQEQQSQQLQQQRQQREQAAAAAGARGDLPEQR